MQSVRLRAKDSNSIYSRNLNLLGDPHGYDLRVESIKHWGGWWNCSESERDVITPYTKPNALLQVSYHTFTSGGAERFGAVITKTSNEGFKSEIKAFKDNPVDGLFHFNLAGINIAREEMRASSDLEYSACLNKYVEHAMERIRKLRR
ncbi:MAG: hypothetical protein KGH66_02515 [Candidatus Micrarchaeota archaeon]|nr:hypothetical protein [Candidatus Micrarchaeota archaeon]